MLTLDQLQVLIAVSETGSFSAAGRRLRRAQSAISTTIQTLEQAQGVLLFDRSGRTPRPTAAGTVLIAEARHILRQSERFESVARGIASGLEPEFTLAVDSLLPSEPIVASLRALWQAFPDLPVTLFTENIGGAERRVRNGSARLALCALLPALAPDLIAEPLMSVPLLPVVAASHPLAALPGPVTRDALEDHTQLVLTDPVDSSGPNFGIISQRIWRFADLGRRLDFLLAGFGWANMPAHLVAPYLADGRLHALPITDPAIGTHALPVHSVHVRKQPPGKAAQRFLEELRRNLG